MRFMTTMGLVALVLVARGAAGGESLDARVEAVLKSPGYGNGHWGVLVVDAKSGEVVYQKNPDELFCPASVTKLYSTGAALAELGADHRFKTPVVRRGEVDKDGTLRGDLILVASGDPTLGGRAGKDGSLLFEDNDHTYANGSNKATLVPADPRAGLAHLAKGVAESGIKRVSGDVLVDDRLFETAASTGSGPTRLTPIVVNDNVIDVLVAPAAKAGEPATVKLVPETAFAACDAQVETVDSGRKPSVEVAPAGPRRFTVRGRIPVGHRPVVKIYEVEEPAAFARSLLIESLRGAGVEVKASPLADGPDRRLPSRQDVKGLPTVAEFTSPPFREYAKVILKVSHNLHASTLPLLIASQHGETTLEAGLRREGAALKSLGVDVDGISFGGGAGGARADLVTPRATVELLRRMAKREDFPAYEAALPILGRDGTLAKAVAEDSPARGHARAKTGTFWVANGLNGRAVLTSKALAGYLDTASGRNLIFAFFVNEVPIGDPDVDAATTAAGKVLGRLCEVFHDDQPKADAR